MITSVEIKRWFALRESRIVAKSKCHRGLRLLLLIVASGFSGALAAAPLYLLSQNQPNPARIYAVESSSLGAPTFIMNVAGAGISADLVELVAVSKEQVYILDRINDALIEINPITATVVGTVSLDRGFGSEFGTGVRGFDVSPSGTLYGIFPTLSQTTELVTIDPEDGSTTVVAQLTAGRYPILEAIAFHSDGRLFAAGTNNLNGCCPSYLYSIDTSSFAVTPIGPMPTEIDTLGFGADDELYGARSGSTRQTLYRFNLATGAQTFSGNTGVFSITGITAEARPTTVSVEVPSTSGRSCLNQSPVVVYGASDFDVTTIDVDTLAFGEDPNGGGRGAGPACSLEDENLDGFTDLVCQFVPGTGVVTLTGELSNGNEIVGTATTCVEG